MNKDLSSNPKSENKTDIKGLIILLTIPAIVLMFIFGHAFFAGIFFILAGLVLLPPFWKIIKEKKNIQLSRAKKIILFIVLIIIAGSLSSANTASETTTLPAQQVTPSPQAIVPTDTPIPTDIPLPTETPTPTPTTLTPQTDNQNVSPVSSETISQRNAIAKAISYLNYTGFSHDGLVAQLEYEQFSNADAIYGADNSGANWNEQAAKKAKSYMEYSAFSRGSLIDQLIYEKFTQGQAEYGANAVGL